MDVVGSEIGQKMRSAIKAKLTELGCYVDDELPDYVMVMVANKRTRAQMEDDLQLFLGDNTELFVNWLHQVLKKLQEVTVPAVVEPEKTKEKVKEKKVKDKKDKDKTKTKKVVSLKKSKKKEKEKLRKKEEKKAHKSKKKSKHHDIIRPNVPPLLMNIEKESEPSITDVFAGQILKNHGVVLDIGTPKEEKPEQKPVIMDIKRPILPIIDPATISQPEVTEINPSSPKEATTKETTTTSSVSAAPREEQIQEINEIEAKIQGLKQKLAEQLDSMSDDEDFLTIRTEAEELMNDFADDVFQEISSQAPPVPTPPVTQKPPSPPPIQKTIDIPTDVETPLETSEETIPVKTQDPLPEVLPQIELKLPKRPVRERLGAREEIITLEDSKKKEKTESSKKETKRTESPERFTPERDPDFWGPYHPSAKSRLGEPSRRSPITARKSPVRTKRSTFSEDSDSDSGSKKDKRAPPSLPRPRATCASVVRVRPRARVAPSSSLLMRAVADAHKSLLNIPPKVDVDNLKVKQALVRPMRRCVDAQNIVIHVPTDRQGDEYEEKRSKSDKPRDEYIPASLTKKFTNTDYVPSRRRRDQTLVIETLNIHNTTVDKDKDTQFIVTMDGFNPNAFLAKKLKTEGLLDEEIVDKPKQTKPVPKPTKPVLKTAEIEPKDIQDKALETENDKIVEEIITNDVNDEKTVEKEDVSPQKKRLSDTSDDSDTQVIIKPSQVEDSVVEKRKSTEVVENVESVPVKKRKASPIVFDMAKKEKEDKKEDVERARQRTESVSSDSQVVNTAVNTHKYDSIPSHLHGKPSAIPPISQAEKKLVWCRSFPLCRYGAACAFQHPRCKFAASCTRRNCVYSHSGVPATIAASPTVASHVVPAANYKSISSAVPNLCKYYPACVNPLCHFYHPKPCRYGPACANKLQCNFYHHELPAKWRYPV